MKSVKDIFLHYGITYKNDVRIDGTDKQTHHNYGDAYEQIIGGMRASADLVLEIGVARGHSLLAWSDVFPNAIVVGMDKEKTDNDLIAKVNRIEFHTGDQRSKDDCDSVAKGRQFDFISEDASHQLEDSIKTLINMWPHLKPGGMYVIEDIGVYPDHDVCVHPDHKIPDECKLCMGIINIENPFGGTEKLVFFRKLR
jgi:SAM-dependent methyltransferase